MTVKMPNQKHRHKKLLSKAKKLCSVLVVKIPNTVLVIGWSEKTGDILIAIPTNGFPAKKIPDERAEKFHTGDTLLPRSGWYF